MTVDEYIASMPQGMGTLNERMGIELVEVSADRVVAHHAGRGQHPALRPAARRRVGGARRDPRLGRARRCTPHPDRVSVGVDINATHHRAATSGTVTGVATAVHLGRSIATYEVVITDEQGRRVCTSRITCLLRDAAPGA